MSGAIMVDGYLHSVLIGRQINKGIYYGVSYGGSDHAIFVHSDFVDGIIEPHQLQTQA